MANTGFSSARSMICPRPASIAMGFLAVLLVMILATPGRAQTFTVLHAFTNIDGAQASGSLLRDDDGNLYGSASYGGDLSCDNGEGCGTIFKLDSAGNMTVLHAFSLGTDGGFPVGALLRDVAGNLYGLTVAAIYKLDTTNTLTVIHRIGAPNPGPALVGDKTGSLYGVTILGGDLTCGTSGNGCGAVYQTNRNTGKTKILHSFELTDGGGPDSGLIRDTAGNLYGTTQSGGDLTCHPPGGCGVVFQLDTAGNLTVLHNFHGGADGETPTPSSLARDSSGNLYGMTELGGDVTCAPP